MSQDKFFNAFCKILNFVNELNNVFGSKYKNIKKYYNLLKKSQTKSFAVSKNASIFESFVTKNKAFIVEKDISKLESDNIVFTENNVFINIRQIMNESDDETKDIIFKHLQVISYSLSGDEKVKEALLKDKDNDNEGKFIDTFMQKVTNVFEKENYSDPLSATFGLLQSGLFNDVVQSLSSKSKSKEISIDKLVNKLQSTMTNMSNELSNSGVDVGPLNQLSQLSSGIQLPGGISPATASSDLNSMSKNTDDMLGSLMNMANGLLSKTGQQIDMSSIMSSVMLNIDPNTLGTSNTLNIQDVTDDSKNKK